MQCNIIEIGGKINDNFTRNIYIDNKSLNKEIERFNKDKYCTVYKYESNKVDECNFIAPLYLDLDIDNIKENFNNLKLDLALTLRQLKNTLKLKDKEIEIYFSGSKGVHVIVPSKVFNFIPSRDLNKELKLVATKLNQYTVYKTIDTRIYDYKRLFRIPNTINSKTGLYKVYIDYNTLKNMTWEELEEYASTPKALPKRLYMKNMQAELAFTLLVDSIKETEASKINTKLANEYIKKRELLPCVKYILQNGAFQGQRNNMAMALANSLFQIGNSSNDVHDIVNSWNGTKNEEPIDHNELKNTINSAYRNAQANKFYGCSAFKDLDVCILECPIHK